MSRIRADQITNNSASGAPTATHGLNVTGTLTAGIGTFSGNVSVGGTLTYEDVTNIDSVGMVTARKGIQVLADGINAVGVVTATSFDGNGSALTNLPLGESNFVASGNISNGDTVVVNADGTVSTITGSGSVDPTVGVSSIFENALTLYTVATYDSANQKVVVAYEDDSNSDYGTAVVGTVTGTGITFGTPVVFNSKYSAYIASTYDSTNGKVIVMYFDYYTNSGVNGLANVGTVSGTSISFSSPILFDSGSAIYNSATYDSTNDKVVFAYQDNGNSLQGTAVVFSPVTISTNLTAENYIGISDGAFTDGQTATIQLIGSVDDAQSGLTAGQKYYVQNDGTLAESGSVFAGTAVSSTSLVVKS